MIVIGLFLLALLKSAIFSLYGFGLLDQGQMLHNGQRILSGDLPYRDFFAVFPPAYNYIFALIFKIFGQSVFISRLVLSVFFSFVPVLIFLITKKILTRNLGIVLAVLIIFMDVNIERLYFFAPILLGIYFYISWLQTSNKNLLFWAGLSLGFASFFRLDISGIFGLGMVISSVISLKESGKKWIRDWLIYCFRLGLGYFIPVAFMVNFLIINDLFYFFFDNTIIQSIYITKLHHLPFPLITDLLPVKFSISWLASLYQIMYSNLLLFTYLVSIIVLVHKWKFFWTKKPWFGFFLISGLLTLPYVLGRTEPGHLLKGGIPFFFLSGYFLKKIYEGKNLIYKLIGNLIIIAFFSATLFESLYWIKFNDSSILINNYNLRLNTSFPADSTIPSKQTLKESVEFIDINSKKMEDVLVLPYMAGLYFLSDRQSPTRFDNVLNGYIPTSAKEELFINQIKHVKVIVYDPLHGPKMGKPRLIDYNPLIHQFIMNNYKIYQQTPEGWLFMLKKDT
ncbi:MAG: hypothetical protein Q7R43_02970 [Candidatus Daviesbacteria bacterium]|nr:hypothetical protein [Candidatus Daviesbacteria bacterium]